jgi:hypothetical protein
MTNISSVDNGATVIGALSDSKEVFDFSNTTSTTGSPMEFEPGKKQKGGTIHAAYLLQEGGNATEATKTEGIAHELFHGYQQINGEKGNDLNKEVAGFLFGRGIAQSLFKDYNPTMGNPNTPEGQQFNTNVNTLLNNQTFDQKLHSETVSLFPKSGNYGSK